MSLRYVPVSLLLVGADIENDPPVLEISNWLHESAYHRSLFPKSVTPSKTGGRALALARERGEDD